MYSVAIEFNWYSYNNSYGAIARAGDDQLRTIIHLLIIVYIYTLAFSSLLPSNVAPLSPHLTCTHKTHLYI